MHLKPSIGLLSAKNGMNLSRGCIHGCIYCDARSKCYQINHEFEDVEIKINAPELLENALKRKRKKCMIGTGAMSDPYVPIPESLKNTRTCLEIIAQHGCGVAIHTKSNLILRDLDILKKINEKAKCVVETTLTTADEGLCRIVEPNVCTTKKRVEMLQTMQENGVKTVVWFTPLLPYINDSEENVQKVLSYCVNAGVYGILCFGIGLTLREGNREYFYSQLDRHFPGLSDRYRQKYGNSYAVMSDNNDALMQLFYRTCHEHGIVCNNEEIFRYMNVFEAKNEPRQLQLFE
ncbi:MAG: radical SAM protein [Bacteroidales bacterium]|jgi:DNA repair photolyase|nr:radical SAM protein [Bacteroidales bacterium]